MTKSLRLKEKKLLAFLHAVDGVGQRRLAWFLDLRKKSKQSLLKIWLKPKVKQQILSSKNTFESYKKLKKEHTIDSYWNSLEIKGIVPLFIYDKEYPFLLEQTATPPVLLYLKYSQAKARKLLSALIPVAVVGSRRITSYGRYVTKKLTTELAIAGATIVSGFMYGVDIQAHLAAIEVGGGTIAVLGFGFDTMFPSSHQEEFYKLLQAGALFISQFPPHVGAAPGNFPARNAVVAGLSLGVLVTEAGIKSGSHITAQLALDEGRAVMAVPGPIDNPYSQGTKWLINEGAILVTSAQDVFLALDVKQANISDKLLGQPTKVRPAAFNFSDPLEAKVYQLLLDQDLTTDEILKKLLLEFDLQASNLTRLAQVLTSLELAGLIERVGVSWQGVRRL